MSLGASVATATSSCPSGLGMWARPGHLFGSPIMGGFSAEVLTTDLAFPTSRGSTRLGWGVPGHWHT